MRVRVCVCASACTLVSKKLISKNARAHSTCLHVQHKLNTAHMGFISVSVKARYEYQ